MYLISNSSQLNNVDYNHVMAAIATEFDISKLDEIAPITSPSTYYLFQ